MTPYGPEMCWMRLSPATACSNPYMDDLGYGNDPDFFPQTGIRHQQFGGRCGMRIIRNPKNNPYWIVITVFLLIFLMVGVLCLQYYKGLQSTIKNREPRILAGNFQADRRKREQEYPRQLCRARHHFQRAQEFRRQDLRSVAARGPCPANILEL